MENKDDEQNKEQLRSALMQLQTDYYLDANGELNEPTARKLKEVYGS